MNNKILGFLAVFLVSILSFRLVKYYQNVSNYIDGQKANFEATVISQPYITQNAQHFSVFLPDGKRVWIVTSTYSELNYGDKVTIAGTIRRRALSSGKTGMTIYFPQIAPQKQSFFSLHSLRQRLISTFEKTLPQASSSLLSGIVFGFKENMPKDFSDNLRASGVTHVVSASGMNVAMVASFLVAFFLLFLKRQLAIVLSIVGVFFYAALSGFEPPIIRASIMGVFVFLGQILGRQTRASYGIFLAGYSMLFVSPYLLQDPGFQLSFLSTLGLLYIRPLFGFLFDKGIGKGMLIGDDIATSISAQIATLPILFIHFGSYSLWSIVANGLVLWTVPILMLLGGAGALFGLFHPLLAQPFLYLALPLLVYFEKAVSVFPKLGGGVRLESAPVSLVAGYYFLVTAFILFFKVKKHS